MGTTIVLYRPQIPPNTGNIARLCVAINTPLIILGKPNFSWDEKQLRRAGLDHWDKLQFRHILRFRDFYQEFSQNRILPISKVGTYSLFEFSFKDGDVLLFGNETAGLPPILLKIFPVSIRIPMWGPVRSLNLSNSVAIVAYEFYRQYYLRGDKLNELHPPRTFYKTKDKNME